MARDDPPLLSLRDEDAIDLGYATDFHILLRAIGESMPEDATLYLEGNATARAVVDFLRQREPAVKPAFLHRLETAGAFHLPLSGGNLSELRLLAEDHARSEVASHLAVYRGDEVLLLARDAGDGAVLLARSLSDETLERFQTALGASLRTPKRYRWFGLLGTRDK